MRLPAPPLLACIAASLAATAGCGPRTVSVAEVTVELHTPAAVDPLDGADTLVVRVLDEAGEVVARASGTPDEGLPVPAVPTFEPVTIEVTARTSVGQVLAAARSGSLRVQEDDDLVLKLLFLPVNEAVPLEWTPNAERVGHAALVTDDDEVLLVGGRTPRNAVARADSERWSIELGFAGEGPVLSDGITHPGSAPLPDGGTLLAGGDADGAASAVVLAVAADGSTVSGLPDLSAPAVTPCVAGLPELGVVVLGPSVAELYTSLGRVGSTNVDHSGVAGCAGADGWVVTAGSDDRWGVIDLREQSWPFDFDAASTWFPGLPDLDGPHVAALPDGTFWIGGGYGFDASVVTRVVDPDRLEITESVELANARTGGQVRVLASGDLVLAGGWSDDVKSAPVRTVDLHDPETGPLLSVPLPVRDPTLTVLPGDALLLTGGLDDEGNGAGAFAIVPWTEDDG